MGYIARLDENNIVEHVHSVDNDKFLDADGVEREEIGIQYLSEIWNIPPERFKQTSYNANIRRKYAGKGDIYDPDLDAFFSPDEYGEMLSWQ